MANRLKIVLLAQCPVPHKHFSDLYEKLTGKGASAGEAHVTRRAAPVPHRDFSDVYEQSSGKGATASEAHVAGRLADVRVGRLRLFRTSTFQSDTRK